jgi:hypothetical protein
MLVLLCYQTKSNLRKLVVNDPVLLGRFVKLIKGLAKGNRRKARILRQKQIKLPQFCNYFFCFNWKTFPSGSSPSHNQYS